MPRVTPAFASSISAPDRTLESGADGEHHPYSSLVTVPGGPKAERALGHPVERFDHAPHGTADRTVGYLLAACRAGPPRGRVHPMDAQDFNEIHIKAVDVRGRLIQLDAE